MNVTTSPGSGVCGRYETVTSIASSSGSGSNRNAPQAGDAELRQAVVGSGVVRTLLDGVAAVGWAAGVADGRRDGADACSLLHATAASTIAHSTIRGRTGGVYHGAMAGLRSGLPDRVTIVEVGPRDGLQNEAGTIPTDVKVELIERLAAAGLPVVEATSFVNPKWVPQLADATDVLARLRRVPGVRYPVLVPNERGLDRALEAGVDEIAIFAAATESFSHRNLNRSRAEALEAFRPVASRALAAGVRVRAYLSMVLGDPDEGAVAPETVVDQGLRLLELGCFELSLGDTIGVGTAGSVEALVDAFVARGVDASALAVHFHDTYGQGLANVLVALQCGVSVVDASAGGLGGCPFARSATGNLATEDVVWMLDGLGVATGVDVREVAETSAWVCAELGKPIPGRVASALSR